MGVNTYDLPKIQQKQLKFGKIMAFEKSIQKKDLQLGR